MQITVGSGLAFAMLFACAVDGADGKNTLVRIDDEPPGANCPYGGKAIYTGVDENENGTLDTQESSNAVYVCNGEPGVPGEDGADGISPPTGILVGSAVILNSFDAALYSGLTEITGDLVIDSGTVTSVTMPLLVRVGGHLDISPQSSVNGAALTSLDLSSLESVSKMVAIEATGLSDLLGLAALTSINGSAFVDRELRIAGNPNLVTFAGLEGLTAVDQLVVWANDALTSLEGLNNLTGPIDRSVQVMSNVELSTLAGISGITTIGENLSIAGNAKLTELGLTSLSIIGNQLVLSNNPLLPCAEQNALAAQLSPPPNSIILNDCP